MFLIRSFDEARREPEMNPKISAYDALLPYRHEDDIYISFTEIDKIGINPRSGYQTPLGIYTYPLKEVWIEYKFDSTKNPGMSVPFLGEMPYIWILRKKKNVDFIEDLSTEYSIRDYNKDIDKLREHIYNPRNSKDWEEFFFLEQQWQKTHSRFNEHPDYLAWNIDKWIVEARNKTPGGLIWNITRELSFLGKKESKRSVVTWNWIFREVLEYSGAADKRGTGIIHSNEPMQAVFFHTRGFDVVKQIYNKNYGVIPKWIKLAKISNAKFSYDDDGRIDWSEGTWNGGTWEDGVWRMGTWENGIWKDGTWRNGVWENGVWKHGWWVKGLWEGGIWEDGEWEDGVWEKGIWENGIWKDGTWKDGTWVKGVWRNGKIYSKRFNDWFDSDLNPNVFKEYEQKPEVTDERTFQFNLMK